jgi:hypothetical protein
MVVFFSHWVLSRWALIQWSSTFVNCDHVTVVRCCFYSYFSLCFIEMSAEYWVLSTEYWDSTEYWSFFCLWVGSPLAVTMTPPSRPLLFRFNCDLRPCHGCLMLFFFLHLLGFIEMSAERWVLSADHSWMLFFFLTSLLCFIEMSAGRWSMIDDHSMVLPFHSKFQSVEIL